MVPKTVILSLEEIVHYIRSQTTPFYQCESYLSRLLEETFIIQSVPYTDGRIALSTQILINDGVPEQLATEIGITSYKLLCDILGMFFKGLTYGQLARKDYCLRGEYDLYIYIPVDSF